MEDATRDVLAGMNCLDGVMRIMMLESMNCLGKVTRTRGKREHQFYKDYDGLDTREYQRELEDPINQVNGCNKV